MKWQVDMKVKDYIRNWSDQEIHTEYKGVTANIKIKVTLQILTHSIPHELTYLTERYNCTNLKKRPLWKRT